MTRFRSNLYNMVISEGCPVCLMNANRYGKTTGRVGPVLLLDKMESVFENYVF